jgi:hypothetical protein
VLPRETVLVRGRDELMGVFAFSSSCSSRLQIGHFAVSRL